MFAHFIPFSSAYTCAYTVRTHGGLTRTHSEYRTKRERISRIVNHKPLRGLTTNGVTQMAIFFALLTGLLAGFIATSALWFFLVNTPEFMDHFTIMPKKGDAS